MLDKNTLVVRGQKKTTRRSSNTKGNDNVISNGSGIAVADGQCMIIVDRGRLRRSAPNRANSHGTAPVNRAFSQANSATRLKRPLPQSESASPTAETPARISAVLLQHQGNSGQQVRDRNAH